METAAGTERLIVLDQPAVGGLRAQDDSGVLTVKSVGWGRSCAGVWFASTAMVSSQGAVFLLRPVRC